MMASVFYNPTHQQRTKPQTQSDLSNQLDFKLSGNTLWISSILKRVSPEAGQHVLSAKSPMLAMNWSLMLDEFLPRNRNSLDLSTKGNKNDRYKPVVLRNKTPFAQLIPVILSPQLYPGGEETNNLRLSKAYTLPSNTDTDVLETLPTGDSSMNTPEEEQDTQSLLSHRLLNFLNRIYIQSCLGDFVGSPHHVGSGLIEFLTSAYYFLYDCIVDIALSVRHMISANVLSRPSLQEVRLDPSPAESINSQWPPIDEPLSRSAVVSRLDPSPAESINSQWPPIDEPLSRSAVVSFGRYCNFETFKTVNL